MDETTLDNLRYEVSENGVDVEDMEETVSKHSFPLAVFMVAVVKDITDAGSFGLLFIVTTPIFYGVWLSYMSGKGRFMKNVMGKWVFRRMLYTTAIEITPVISMLPASSALVIMAHYRESAIVKELDLLIDAAYHHRGLAMEEILRVAHETPK